MRTALEVCFWASAGLIAWTHLGYGAALALLARAFARPARRPRQDARASVLPSLSLIIAAHDEEAVIAQKVRNARALDYADTLVEVITLFYGQAFREAIGLFQDAAVARARGEIVAFSDANAQWRPDAARERVGAFADPRVGYACGQVRFTRAAPAGSGAPNQEGIYWRYELAVRELESRLCSVTAGNGAIYATRRSAYMVVDPIMGHDLALPFKMVKRGLRAVYVPQAQASERMVPSLAGEFARKRRMMSHTWPIVLRGGMLSPRGYPPGYALMILSHRVLRYATPGLHALALAANVALLAIGGVSPLYTVTLALQLALLVAAALAGPLPARPLLIARYYVLTTASPAAGLWDWLRHGTSASWVAAEGTR